MDNARSRYIADAIETASPARLLTMLYDRLILDLSRAEKALDSGDRNGAMPLVGHAEEIVGELMGMLDERVWDGAARLMSIYAFVLKELLAAGATGNRARIARCRALLEPLALAWHEAADEVGRASVPAQRDDEVRSPGLLGVG
ncbi:MAG TPA: flagellar export chaperone FliS [Cellulomonas sp.]